MSGAKQRSGLRHKHDSIGSLIGQANIDEARMQRMLPFAPNEQVAKDAGKLNFFSNLGAKVMKDGGYNEQIPGVVNMTLTNENGDKLDAFAEKEISIGGRVFLTDKNSTIRILSKDYFGGALKDVISKQKYVNSLVSMLVASHDDGYSRAIVGERLWRVIALPTDTNLTDLGINPFVLQNLKITPVGGGQAKYPTMLPSFLGSLPSDSLSFNSGVHLLSMIIGTSPPSFDKDITQDTNESLLKDSSLRTDVTRG
jgi:hypothetical protein